MICFIAVCPHSMQHQAGKVALPHSHLRFYSSWLCLERAKMNNRYCLERGCKRLHKKQLRSLVPYLMPQNQIKVEVGASGQCLITLLVRVQPFKTIGVLQSGDVRQIQYVWTVSPDNGELRIKCLSEKKTCSFTRGKTELLLMSCFDFSFL